MSKFESEALLHCFMFHRQYTDLGSHNLQRYNQTDRQTYEQMDGQTDDMIMPTADNTVYQYDRLKNLKRPDQTKLATIHVRRCRWLPNPSSQLEGATQTPAVRCFDRRAFSAQ